jgi:hypothetical protein
MPKKEFALIVNQTTLTTMVLRQITSSVSAVGDAINALFGNVLMSKNAMSLPGSNSGSKKAIPFADSQNFLDTAHSKSSKLKTIGLINFQCTTPISQPFDTHSVMALISERITALSPL